MSDPTGSSQPAFLSGGLSGPDGTTGSGGNSISGLVNDLTGLLNSLQGGQLTPDLLSHLATDLTNLGNVLNTYAQAGNEQGKGASTVTAQGSGVGSLFSDPSSGGSAIADGLHKPTSGHS